MYKELQPITKRTTYTSTTPTILSKVGSKITSAWKRIFNRTNNPVLATSMQTIPLETKGPDHLFCKEKLVAASSHFATLSSVIDNQVITWKDARYILSKISSNNSEVPIISSFTVEELRCIHDAIEADMFDSLLVLGGKLESVKYVASLHINGKLSFLEIMDVFSLLKETGFPFEFVRNLHVNDFLCLKHLLLLKNTKGAIDPVSFFSSMPKAAVMRCNYWLAEAMKETPYLITTLSFNSSLPDEDVLNAIAEYYITCSGKELNERRSISIAYAISRSILIITTGIKCPEHDLLKLFVLWFAMYSTMVDHVWSESQYLDPAIVPICCCVATFRSYISSYAIKLVDFFASKTDSVFDKISKETREKILSFFSKNGIDVDAITKFRSWNRTLSILSDIPNLTKSSSIRMLATYSLAQSYIRAFTLNLDLVAFIKESSPIPNNHSVHGILRFYRRQKDYLALCQAKKMAFYNLYQTVVRKEKDGTKEVEVEIEGETLQVSSVYVAYRLYFELLKLNFAFLPNIDSPHLEGAYYDPEGHYVDRGLLSDICSYLTSDSRFSYIASKKLQNNVLAKLRRINEDKYMSYMLLFGEPNFSLFKKKIDYTIENA